MDAATALKLAHKYTACPDCGITYVGDGEGTIRIDENLSIEVANAAGKCP
jgi:hypothetical protein